MGEADALAPDAARLLRALAALPEASFPDRVMPGEVAVALGIAPRRAWRILRDWWARGWYEYEISAYSGRLTPAGRARAAHFDQTQSPLLTLGLISPVKGSGGIIPPAGGVLSPFPSRAFGHAGGLALGADRGENIHVHVRGQGQSQAVGKVAYRGIRQGLQIRVAFLVEQLTPARGIEHIHGQVAFFLSGHRQVAHEQGRGHAFRFEAPGEGGAEGGSGRKAGKEGIKQSGQVRYGQRRRQAAGLEKLTGPIEFVGHEPGGQPHQGRFLPHEFLAPSLAIGGQGLTPDE